MVYQIIVLYILKHSWESSLNKVSINKSWKPKNVFGDLKNSLDVYSCHLILVLVSSTEDNIIKYE